MSLPLEKLEAEAMQLPTAERARLARILIASLDADEGADPLEVERAWEQEIYRRVKEIRSGKARLVPAEEVLGELRGRHSS
jgi:putative addiction module component (TIGR02574 family)